MSRQGAEYHLPEKQLRYGGVMDYGDERVSVQFDGLRLVEEVEKRECTLMIYCYCHNVSAGG